MDDVVDEEVVVVEGAVGVECDGPDEPCGCDMKTQGQTTCNPQIRYETDLHACRQHSIMGNVIMVTNNDAIPGTSGTRQLEQSFQRRREEPEQPMRCDVV